MNKSSLRYENLESRRLLAGDVFVDGGNLVIEGTVQADVIVVRRVGNELQVVINDVDQGFFSLSLIHI